MKRNPYCFAFYFLLLSSFSFSQEINDKDLEYYNNWLGEWHREIEGKVNDLPSLIVSQGPYKESFEEIWIGPGGSFSKAWRAFDYRTKKWDFAWLSSDRHFQLWDGKKINGIWYMYKYFILDNGEKVLSRQAFIPEDSKTVIRTSEHSSDEGKTWKLRFTEKYVKVK